MSDSTKILVPNELFAPAESSYFHGEFNLGKLVAGPDTYHFAEPLTWELTITNTGDALLVGGTVSGTAQGECARCLDEYLLPVSGQIEGYYLLSDEENPPEDMDEDEFDILPEDKIIDLEPLLSAAVLLELPLVPLCNEECQGLCIQCGANLNEGECDCAPLDDSEEEFSENPFAVLKDLKFE